MPGFTSTPLEMQSQNISIWRSSLNHACYFQLLLVQKTDLSSPLEKKQDDKTKPQHIPEGIKQDSLPWRKCYEENQLFLMSSGSGDYSTFYLRDRKHFSSGRELLGSHCWFLQSYWWVPLLLIPAQCVHCNLWCEMRRFFFFLLFPTDSLFRVNRELKHLTWALCSFSHLPATSLLPQGTPEVAFLTPGLLLAAPSILANKTAVESLVLKLCAIYVYINVCNPQTRMVAPKLPAGPCADLWAVAVHFKLA